MTPVQKILERRYAFLATFLAVFFVSLAFLQIAEIVPPALAPFRDRVSSVLYEPYEPPTQNASDDVAVEEGELPTLIEIPAVGVKANVSNPESTDISALDRALLAGAVRYPQSGILGEKGNVLLFGHSSYLPIVHNQAYKAFNDIQDLKQGEEILVYGETKVYVYAVEKVEEANTSTGEIPLRVDGAYLTLATCDTFGAKSDRFIVTAVLKDIREN